MIRILGVVVVAMAPLAAWLIHPGVVVVVATAVVATPVAIAIAVAVRTSLAKDAPDGDEGEPARRAGPWIPTRP